MSAEVLREAATAIRKREDLNEQMGRIDDRTYRAWLAVADWLESVYMDAIDEDESEYGHAVAISHAYLGTTA